MAVNMSERRIVCYPELVLKKKIIGLAHKKGMNISELVTKIVAQFFAKRKEEKSEEVKKAVKKGSK